MIWFIKTGGYQAAGEGHVGSVVIIKVKNLLV